MHAKRVSRRAMLRSIGTAGLYYGFSTPQSAGAFDAQQETQSQDITRGILGFIHRCARDDGGYSPAPQRDYPGSSDTALSDLAAVTYAAVLARTFAWDLPHVDRSIDFVNRHQQGDGSFINLDGQMNPRELMSVLYNTTQGTVALRAMGHKPPRDPTPVVARFFERDAYQKLPWYAMSFFPLLFIASGQKFVREYQDRISGYLTENQKPDGYVQDHVAATFHLAHFYRLLDQPVPRASAMVQRTIRDQKPDGGWDIKDPDWDVHACFDAMFILRQLGEGSAVKQAMSRGGTWALRCRNSDGGFGHYPRRHSDMDAVYFNIGAMIQAGTIETARIPPDDAKALGWGHAMAPPAK